MHAVAVEDGAVIAEAGDPLLTCFMRSSSKPLQAIPLARARADVDSRDLAIASASHLADPAQLEAVQALLDKDPPSRLNHNCSGKHAGMLALCRAQGWPTQGYRLPEHPVQRAALAVHAEAAEVAEHELPTGVDGCGVVTFALPLERMAFAFTRIGALDGGARVAAAMREHPELICGPDAPDTRIMKRLAGWIAKGGAEGLLCAAADGIGVALKSEDGNGRALGPAAHAFFRRLGLEVPELEVLPLRNSRGERVGEIVAE